MKKIVILISIILICLYVYRQNYSDDFNLMNVEALATPEDGGGLIPPTGIWCYLDGNTWCVVSSYNALYIYDNEDSVLRYY